MQLHGGIGMTWEHPAHLYLKRAKADQIALGAAGTHRARTRGTGRPGGLMSAIGTVEGRLQADVPRRTVRMKVSVTCRSTSPASCGSPPRRTRTSAAALGDLSFSYAQVDELAGRVAGGLRAAGLQPGDKVAVHLPNVPQFVFAYFGILKAGMTMVPICPLLTAPEVAYHLTDSDSRALVTHEQIAAPALAGAADAGRHVPTYVVGDGDAPAGARDFAELTAADVWDDHYPTWSDDAAVVVYTSGTTGRPKGAELTHFQLLMNADTPGRLFGVRRRRRPSAVLPLFHVFGLSSILDVCVRFAATMTLVPRFDAAAVLEVIQQDRVTVFEGVPAMYVALLNRRT